MSNVLIGEFIGTMLLVLLGDGVCANVTQIGRASCRERV